MPPSDILVVFCIENFTRRETLLLDAARLVLLLLALAHPDRVGRDLDELVVDDVLDGLQREEEERAEWRRWCRWWRMRRWWQWQWQPVTSSRLISFGGIRLVLSSFPAARMFVSCFVLQMFTFRSPGRAWIPMIWSVYTGSLGPVAGGGAGSSECGVLSG